MILAASPSDGLGAWHLVAILFSAAITDNILLTRFLGMCSFLSVSRQLKAAAGLGLAVTVVTGCTAVINAAVYRHLLVPCQQRYGLPADTMVLLLFILVIAGFVQFLEMLIERLSLGLYYALGIFLPLITVNCAILGTSLFMVNRGLGVLEGGVFGFGSGLGWFLAIVLMAGVRRRLAHARVPAGLEGPGIALIIAGIMALAFIGFSGIIKI